MTSSTLVSRQLATTRMLLCASPGYLETHGVPRHPHELAEYVVLAYSYWSTGDEWRFEGPDGPVSVRTHPSLTTNSGDTCRAAGTLVHLMPEYRAVELGIYAVYPTRKHIPAKVKALLDFLSEHFSTEQPAAKKLLG